MPPETLVGTQPDPTVKQPEPPKDDGLPGNTREEKIIAMIRTNFQESYNYLKGSRYFDDWKEFFNKYRCIPKRKNYNWMSNKFIPATNSKVDTGLANIMEMLFQIDPPIEVKPLPFGKGDDFHAGIIKTLLAKQIKSDDIFFKLMCFIKNLLIYGTSFAKIYWSHVKKKIRFKRKKYRGIMDYFGTDISQLIPTIRRQMTGQEITEEVIEIEDGPTLDIANIGDIFPDPLAIDVNSGWMIHRVKRPISHLRALMSTGVYNEEVNKITKADATESKDGKYDIESSEGRQHNTPVTRPEIESPIELLEWHGLFDDNEDGYPERCIFTLAAGKYLIRGKNPKEGMTPFWHEDNPFVRGVYIPLPNEMYGMGICELCDDLQNMLNENVNQRQDNITLILNPLIKYRKNSGIKMSQLIMSPGRTVGEDQPGDVSFDRPGDVTASSFAQTHDIERWMQEVTAITKLTLSTGGTEMGRTATAAGLLQQNANTRFAITAKIIENMAFSKIIKMFYEMDYQFYDEEKIGTLIGIDPAKIDIEKMRPDYYQFEAAGVKTMEDTNQKALKLLQFGNIAKDFPEFKKSEWLRKVYVLLRVGDNPFELIYTPEEAQKVQSEKMLEQLFMMQMQSGMVPGKPGAPGPGQEGTQFKEGNAGGTPGLPPSTSPVPPDQNMGPTEPKL